MQLLKINYIHGTVVCIDCECVYVHVKIHCLTVTRIYLGKLNFGPLIFLF